MELAEELEELGVEAKLIVFDAWYFALKLVTRLRDRGLDWVTRSKPKKNRLFNLDGATVHGEEVINSGVRETMAEQTCDMKKGYMCAALIPYCKRRVERVDGD